MCDEKVCVSCGNPRSAHVGFRCPDTGLISPIKNSDDHIEKYTANGEITYNNETKEYTVWCESYADTVCVTNYPKVAEAALKAYADNYL